MSSESLLKHAGPGPGPRSGWLRAPNDFVAGLFLLACAGLGAWFGKGLSVGTAYRMGPGYIPRLLVWIVAIFGVALVLGAFRRFGPTLERWPLRPTVLVLGAMVVFGLSIERAGLLLSSVLVVLMASLAAPQARWRDAILLALCLSGGACLLFPLALQLPLRVFP
jgi:hypothetical protein